MEAEEVQLEGDAVHPRLPGDARARSWRSLQAELSLAEDPEIFCLLVHRDSAFPAGLDALDAGSDQPRDCLVTARRAAIKSNSYLITKTDGTSDEILADHYEREGDEWVFMIGSKEVLRMAIDQIASITKTGRAT